LFVLCGISIGLIHLSSTCDDPMQLDHQILLQFWLLWWSWLYVETSFVCISHQPTVGPTCSFIY
jgi:hypothetical protein